jgi:hypothetical protein
MKGTEAVPILKATCSCGNDAQDWRAPQHQQRETRMGNGAHNEPPKLRNIIIGSAIGGFIGSLLALLLWMLFCGCPCQKPADQSRPAISQQAP